MAEKTSNFTTMDAIRTAIWSGAGLVLGYIGIHTSESIDLLGNEMGQLRVVIAKLESKVDRLPPAELMLKITNIESSQTNMRREDERLQRQIDVLEAWLDKTTQIPKPDISGFPYTNGNN